MMAKSKNNPKKKPSTKILTKQKQKRRKLVTFVRMCRYGINNFSRNAWLTIAATAVMAITLLIIFATLAAHSILNDTIGDLRDKVDMSIYLETDTTDEEGAELVSELRQLDSVRSASFVSAEQAREQFIQDNRHDASVLEAIKEATNKNPATLRVVVEDINDTSELRDFVDNNELIAEHINPDRPPSFAGERRSSIESIGRAASFAQRVGIITGAIFVVVSSLIIFNTIRMAIFNRKEEIQMMSLIGADKSFIRGPFIVEAIVYGFIAAILATGLGILGLHAVSEPLSNYQISVQPTIDMFMFYIGFVLLGMIVAGAFIGVVSSLLATHRYLKM